MKEKKLLIDLIASTEAYNAKFGEAVDESIASEELKAFWIAFDAAKDYCIKHLGYLPPLLQTETKP